MGTSTGVIPGSPRILPQESPTGLTQGSNVVQQATAPVAAKSAPLLSIAGAAQEAAPPISNNTGTPLNPRRFNPTTSPLFYGGGASKRLFQ